MIYEIDTGDVTEADFLLTADAYPNTDVADISNILLKNDNVFASYKDNREILGGTIQLQQQSKDKEKVGLGRVLSSRNRLVSENPPSSIKLYYSNTLKFNRNNVFNVPSGYSYSGIPTITTVPTSHYATVSGISSSWSSWCLTDENDKILIWCNQDGTALDTITFDFLNKASDIKYKY